MAPPRLRNGSVYTLLFASCSIIGFEVESLILTFNYIGINKWVRPRETTHSKSELTALLTCKCKRVISLLRYFRSANYAKKKDFYTSLLLKQVPRDVWVSNSFSLLALNYFIHKFRDSDAVEHSSQLEALCNSLSPPPPVLKYPHFQGSTLLLWYVNGHWGITRSSLSTWSEREIRFLGGE